MKKLKELLLKYYIFEIFAWALTLNIIIELLSRDSIRSLVNHITTYPIYFILNLLMIGATLSVSGFFKKKRIALMVIGIVWLALGVANHIVLSYRITPFAAIDLSIMEWDLDFLESYLSISLVIFIVIAVFIGITSLVYVYRKAKVTEVYWKSTALMMCVLTLLSGGTHISFAKTGVYEPRISDMQESYDKFGFVSCFVRSATERGIDMPEGYSEEMMDNLAATLEVTENKVEVTPNVIVVQLESFFDPELLKDTEFSSNPIPTFTKLSEEYSSGALEVSVVGAGTANTEFEVLTSMSVDYFGTGEYPYESILKENTCESAAYNLKKLGYTTFALHNNTGTFYERYKVYPNLGFDTFISSEFMADTTTTPQGWIKDECLTPQIEKCLNSTEGQDFIFAVSVQGHGSFPEEEMENPVIEVTESPFEEGLENQVEYYVNQLYEMDLFVKELTEYLSGLDEPTILVLYGDHIPSLDIDASYYEDEDNYKTSYVIWSNYEIQEIDQDLCTYQLLPRALELVNINEGVLTQFHQEVAEEEDYLESLQAIQYDLLYGDAYLYEDGKYEPTNMTMGIGEMEIQTYYEGEFLNIVSPDITESSVVFINEKAVESTLIHSGHLSVIANEIQVGDQLVIKQISPDETVLYESEIFDL